MSSYKSLTQHHLAGTLEDIGHTLGLAAVLMRLIEFIGEGDKETIKALAKYLSEHAIADIERMNDDATPKDQQDAVKEHARAAINIALLPAINFETVQ